MDSRVAPPQTEATMQPEKLFWKDRIVLVVLYGAWAAVAVGVLAMIGAACRWLFFGDGWKIIKKWLDGQPTSLDIVASALLVCILLCVRLMGAKK